MSCVENGINIFFFFLFLRQLLMKFPEFVAGRNRSRMINWVNMNTYIKKWSYKWETCWRSVANQSDDWRREKLLNKYVYSACSLPIIILEARDNWSIVVLVHDELITFFFLYTYIFNWKTFFLPFLYTYISRV